MPQAGYLAYLVNQASHHLFSTEGVQGQLYALFNDDIVYCPHLCGTPMQRWIARIYNYSVGLRASR